MDKSGSPVSLSFLKITNIRRIWTEKLYFIGIDQFDDIYIPVFKPQSEDFRFDMKYQQDKNIFHKTNLEMAKIYKKLLPTT